MLKRFDMEGLTAGFAVVSGFDKAISSGTACKASFFRRTLVFPVIGIGARMPTVYFELSKGLTNLRPLGPVPLTCRTVSSSISMKCGTLAGSV